MLSSETLLMAQVGVGGDFGTAIVLTVAIILAWAVLLCLSAVLFIWGLVTVRRPAGVVRLLIGGALVAGMSYAPFALAQRSRPRFSVSLDFRESRTPPLGKWIGVDDLRWRSYEGIIDTHLRLPYGLEYNDIANLVSLRRTGDQIDSISIQRFGLSKSEAMTLEKKYSHWEGRHIENESRHGMGGIVGTVDVKRIAQQSWTVQISAMWESPSLAR